MYADRDYIGKTITENANKTFCYFHAHTHTGTHMNWIKYLPYLPSANH